MSGIFPHDGRVGVLVARPLRLYSGLALFGLSIALMVDANLGLGPWDVLHQGLARTFNIPIGWVVVGISALVLLAWIPMRERPGLGTISNALLVGPCADFGLDVLPEPHQLAFRFGYLLAGVVLTGAATGLYIGARFGPGPRDGLMTGLARRGHSIRMVRTTIEVAAGIVGFLLGGTVGIGTVVYAFSIGPLVQIFLRTDPISRPRTPLPAERNRGKS